MTTMRAHHVINLEDWEHPSLAWELDLDGVWPVTGAVDVFLRGYSMLKRGDRSAAEAALDELRAVAVPAEDAAKLQVMTGELEALLLLDAGQTETGVAVLEAAAAIEAAMPVEFGPPMIVKPSFELLGEVHLALDRPVEAQQAYEQALALAPRRALSLMGLVQAAAAAGDEKTAARTRAALREIWHRADPGLTHVSESTSPDID
jgi:tetratricopeptide (TPR) repeat protein